MWYKFIAPEIENYQVSLISVHSTSIYFWALVYIGMSNVTYSSIRLFKLANTLSGREAIMFEDKSLTRQKLDK